MDELDELLGQIRTSLQSANYSDLNQTTKMDSGRTQGGSGGVPHSCPPVPRCETLRVAGVDQVQFTKQVRLRLPHGLAEAIWRSKKSLRADVFLITVFGALGNDSTIKEIVAGFKELQRIGALLRQSLLTDLSDDLLTRVKEASKMIDRICRPRCICRVLATLRLPQEYADTLLMLSPSEREMIIRLAVSAREVSICISSLVRKAHVLRRLRGHLIANLDSGVTGPPNVEVRELLIAISELQYQPAEGGRP